MFLAGASGDAAEEPTKEREKQTSLDNRRQLTPLNTKVGNRSTKIGDFACPRLRTLNSRQGA